MVAAGWYADPAGGHPYRYWDGAQWTDHVAGPSGQGLDPLTPPPVPEGASTTAAQPAQQQPAQQPAQQQQAEQAPAASTGQPLRTDPTEMQAVLAELGLQPMPPGDGTPYGEPMLVLAFSEDRPDALEWWTPTGQLVAVATILEKQQPGTMDAPTTDPASGAMIGSRIEVTGADGTPIATTVRTLKPMKPPTFIDAPGGHRLASVAQEKAFSKIAKIAVTASDGTPVGRFVATDARGRAVVLSDAAGSQQATVIKHGKWDGANVALEFSRNRPFQTPTEWLASRAVSTLLPIKRERICSVVVRDRPPAGSHEALMTFLAPLLLEHVLSLV